MPDYNIYIRTTGGANSNGIANKTVPLDNQYEGDSEISSFRPFVNQALQQASSFESGGFSSLVNTGVSMLKKAVPWLAAAFIVGKISQNMVENSLSLYSQYTGNFNYEVGWNNFKTQISNLINPIGLWRYNNERTAQFNALNKQIEQRKSLIGTTSRGI